MGLRRLVTSNTPAKTAMITRTVAARKRSFDPMEEVGLKTVEELVEMDVLDSDCEIESKVGGVILRSEPSVRDDLPR